MKHKAGDVVRVKSKEWYKKKCNSFGDVRDLDGRSFVSGMKEFLGKIITITEVREKSYICNDENGITRWLWTDEMFED